MYTANFAQHVIAMYVCVVKINKGTKLSDQFLVRITYGYIKKTAD